MPAHQPSTCHRLCVKPSLPGIGTCTPRAQKPAWHAAQDKHRHAGLQQPQDAEGHVQNSRQVRCYAGQAGRFGVPTVEWLSYEQDPSKAEACTQVIANALAADPLSVEHLKDAKQFFISSTRLMLRMYPTLPQLVVARLPYDLLTRSDGQGISAAHCKIVPRWEEWKPEVYPGHLEDLLTTLTASRPSALLRSILNGNASGRALDAFIKDNGGRVLFLANFGTDPEHQGRGLGSAVLEEVVAAGDRLQLPVYLMASTSRSAALYARYGFSVQPQVAPGTCMARLPSPLQERL